MKNWIIKVSSIMVTLFVLIMNQSFIQAQEDGDDIVIGKYKIIHSNVLDEDRLLLIHLPREYGETQMSAPKTWNMQKGLPNFFNLKSLTASVLEWNLGNHPDIS